MWFFSGLLTFTNHIVSTLAGGEAIDTDSLNSPSKMTLAVILDLQSNPPPVTRVFLIGPEGRAINLSDDMPFYY